MFDSITLKPHHCFDDPAMLAGLGPVNCILGANNSGKSSLIKALRTIGGTWEHIQGAGWNIAPLAPKIARELRQMKGHDLSGYMTISENAVPRVALYALGGPVRDRKARLIPSAESVNALMGSIIVHDWHVVQVAGQRLSSDDLRKALLTRCQQVLAEAPRLDPQVFEIPGRRHLALRTDTPSFGSTYSQQGLIVAIRQLQESEDESSIYRLANALAEFHPLFREHQLRVRRHEVLGHELLVLHHPGTGRRFPLDSFGDGLHQIVLLIAPIILKEMRPADGTTQLMLIEEPETNLHPSLWRGVLRRLTSEAESGQCQLFVTTHSRDVMSALSRAALIWTRQLDAGSVGGCTVSNASRLIDDADVTVELYGRPCHQDLLAELLLGGRVLVVEGPSDQMVYQHVARELGLHDVRVVNVQGDGEVPLVVAKLRSIFGNRAFGIVDASKKYRSNQEGVHVASRKGLEAYLMGAGPGRKLDRALRALRGTGGAYIDHEALSEETRAALGHGTTS